MPANSNLRVTSRIGPKSTVDILINIKALPQMAPNNIKRIQFFNSMYKRYLNDVYELQNYKDKFQLKIEDNLGKKEKKRSLPKEASNYQS